MLFRSRTVQVVAAVAVVAAFALVPARLVPAGSAAVGDCNTDPAWGTSKPALADDVVTLINQHRASLGLATLQVSQKLTAAAVWKAMHMANYAYLAHDDPAPPVARSWSQRIEACGYTPTGIGENIAYGYGTAQSVLAAWLASPGHRSNIEYPSYRATGVGAAADRSGIMYWSQEFGSAVESGGGGAPTVSLSSTPPATTTLTSASFSWTAAGTVTSTTCSLDGAAATACSTPKSYTGLAGGAHSFVVTVSNSSGSASASFNWTVSQDPPPGSPPTVTITTAPAASTTATNASFSWTAGGSPDTVTCSLDGAAATACSSPKSYSGLAVGQHTFVVTVSNFYGSTAGTHTWTVTAPPPPGTPPTVTITSNPPASTTETTAGFSWSTGGGAPDTTACSLDGSVATACSSPKSYSGLSVGTHTFRVVVSNAYGTNTATYVWSVTAPPSDLTVWIYSAPLLQTTDTNAQFVWVTTGDVAGTTCSLDGSPEVACSPPKSYAGLVPGTHSFRVTVSNAKGSTSTSYVWTIKGTTTKPTVTLTSTPPVSTTDTAAAFAWSTTGSPTSTTCSLDGGLAAACTSPKSYSGLTAGSHMFTVTVSSSSGSAFATYTWSVTQPAGTAPTVAISSGPSATTTSTSASFAWSTTGSPTSTSCSLDNGPAAPCTSPTTYNALATTTHTFKVTVGNAFGSNSATYSWTVTSPPPVGTAPTVTLTTVPDSTTSSTSASFAWSTTGSPTSATCSLDGALAVPCSSPTAYSALAASPHSFRVTVSNAYGSNSATYSWTISAPPPVGAPPTVTITSAPATSTTSTSASFSWTTTGTVLTTTCSLDGGAPLSCSSPAFYNSVAPGSHTFTVSVGNAYGSRSETFAWTVAAAGGGDLSVWISSAPLAQTTSTSADFVWVTTGTVVTTTCSLDGSPEVACSVPKSYTALSVGTHTFRVTVSNAGARESTTYTWTVVAAAPKVTLMSTPSSFTTSTDATFTWLTTGTVTSTTCSLDGGAASACSSPKTLTGLAKGYHVFTVVAWNGTASRSTSYGWTIY